MKRTSEILLNYLNEFGLLCCNKNAYIKSIEDIGCTWQDMIYLINTHQIFYCKIYRHKTVYLSQELYFLLKTIQENAFMSSNAERIYRILENNPPQSTEMFKAVSGLTKKEFNAAQLELLEKLLITAISSYKSINVNWSSFLYGTSIQWEESGEFLQVEYSKDDARSKAINILEKTLRESDIAKILKLLS
jgi:hypothetical protein